MQPLGVAVPVERVWGVASPFAVLLPIQDIVADFEKVPATVLRGAGHILVVDDEDVMRNAAKAMLEELGYEITVAENGIDALRLFEARPDAFDLVLLDMIMPKMNGLDCFTKMRHVRPEVKVILVSGFTKEGDLEKMNDNGLAGFIRKPFRRVALSQIVHDVIDAG
ncbi:hypothetical protein BVX99_02870 [bacterium F16]|nr:hypothetical protein BVX99_02870 [bacterium F16]